MAFGKHRGVGGNHPPLGSLRVNSSSNYIVHSYYNRTIADVQLRASSFLHELIIAFETADNRILVTSLSLKRN